MSQNEQRTGLVQKYSNIPDSNHSMTMTMYKDYGSTKSKSALQHHPNGKNNAANDKLDRKPSKLLNNKNGNR